MLNCRYWSLLLKVAVLTKIYIFLLQNFIIYHLAPTECWRIANREKNKATASQNPARWKFEISSIKNSNTAAPFHLVTLVVVQQSKIFLKVTKSFQFIIWLLKLSAILQAPDVYCKFTLLLRSVRTNWKRSS